MYCFWQSKSNFSITSYFGQESQKPKDVIAYLGQTLLHYSAIESFWQLLSFTDVSPSFVSKTITLIALNISTLADPRDPDSASEELKGLPNVSFNFIQITFWRIIIEWAQVL